MNESDVEAAMHAAHAFWLQSGAQSAVGVPEITVTLNMLNHADALGYDLCGEQYAAIYRAMAAVAPVDLFTTNDRETEAYQYLKRLFLHMAPQCCVLPDLLGVCTQVDNAIAGLTIENGSLKAQLIAFTAFTADQPDLPDPLRRPDGTLMPQPKALTLPREIGDKRRVGS